MSVTSSARRDLGLVLQKPPTPLTVARHCANVSNPQLVGPPRMLYCAHHGYSRAWPIPVPSSSIRAVAAPYVARMAILLDRPITVGRRAPGRRERDEVARPRASPSGRVTGRKAHASARVRAVLHPMRFLPRKRQGDGVGIGGFPSTPAHESATFSQVIGRLQTLPNAGSCRRQSAS